MNRLKYYLKRVKNPNIYQGMFKKKNYFEGWYYNLLLKDATRLVFIVGISLHSDDPHAFIQCFKNSEPRKYYRFSLNEFSYSIERFEIKIGNNYFSENSIEVALDDVVGSIAIRNHTKFPTTTFTPNIMGPLTYLPFLECYHSIVAIEATTFGYMYYDGLRFDADQGLAYIEKDYGKKFPISYSWHLSNKFQKSKGVCVTAEARIPFYFFSIHGHFAFMYYNQETSIFSTYNFSRLKINKRKNFFSFYKDKEQLHVILDKKKSVELQAPDTNGMSLIVKEAIDCESHIIYIKNRQVLFDDISEKACFEEHNI